MNSNNISAFLEPDEKIVWNGSPVSSVFIASSIPIMIFGLIFLAMSSVFAVMALLTIILAPFGLLFVLIGLVITLAPLWQYISLRNIEYAITTKRIIVTGGIIGKDVKVVDFDKIQNSSVEVGLFDKLLGMDTGTIRIFSGETVRTKNGTSSISLGLHAIPNPYEVFKQLKQVSFDVKTDIEYPNQMRPQNNPGYKTEYMPEDPISSEKA